MLSTLCLNGCDGLTAPIVLMTYCFGIRQYAPGIHIQMHRSARSPVSHCRWQRKWWSGLRVRTASKKSSVWVTLCVWNAADLTCYQEKPSSSLSSCGLVAMTSASHAEDRWIESRMRKIYSMFISPRRSALCAITTSMIATPRLAIASTTPITFET